MNKKITTTLLAVAAVFAVAAPTASATHGGNHASLHREFDVNIPLPAVTTTAGPIASVCVSDGVEQTCTASELSVSLGGFMAASYHVIVDVLAKTAREPTWALTDCAAPKQGKEAAVGALGTGLQNARFQVIDNLTGQVLVDQWTGPVLGNRVELDFGLCSNPNG